MLLCMDMLGWTQSNPPRCETPSEIKEFLRKRPIPCPRSISAFLPSPLPSIMGLQTAALWHPVRQLQPDKNTPCPTHLSHPRSSHCSVGQGPKPCPSFRTRESRGCRADHLLREKCSWNWTCSSGKQRTTPSSALTTFRAFKDQTHPATDDAVDPKGAC